MREKIIRVATVIVIHEFKVICPYCGEEQGGFIDDPSGGEFICNDCNQSFIVMTNPAFHFS